MVLKIGICRENVPKNKRGSGAYWFYSGIIMVSFSNMMVNNLHNFALKVFVLLCEHIVVHQYQLQVLDAG